ncbi:DUF7284 family protein [Haloplanus aerogenes]|uniref:Uncharacterized protein n=1 Tax=Haloplanus aerogenes TaxID=660522 RepID=A0A3G8QU35_9EURY|nr:hypothetical protein [Haloplanus aerogenes]AZH24957.1 hypothetical protein DU502_06050 [Haloplanus aerogenes]
MTSTVLDGLLCLLLVSAAVVTVTTATPQDPAGEGRAPDVAATLSTTTAAVNYTLTPRFETTSVDVPRTGGSFDRTAHGTLAELLARATVARITADGERLSHARDGFGRAVVRAVRGAIRANHTQITAVWRPYPASSIAGRLVIGSRPPPDRPVHAATVDVPSGFPAREQSIRRAARDRGVDGVADAVADGLVAGLFPPTRTRIAASSASPSAALVRHRYRRVANRFGAAPPTRLGDGGVDAANDRLEAAVSERVQRDLRETNTSATAAANAVRLGRVRIVVRTWP